MINEVTARVSRTLGIIVTCLAVMASVFTAPIVAAEETTDNTGSGSELVKIDNGSVTWGIRSSWRTYIGDGALLYDGVTLNDNKEYVWPIKEGTYDPSTKELHLKLGGYIHNLAYCNPPDSYDNCTLDVLLKELEVDITPSEQRITGIFVGNTREDLETKELPRMTWANLKLSGVEASTSDSHTKIADIPGYIGDFPLYGRGAVADPVTIEYDGPGGLPKTDREFGAPGALTLQFDKDGAVIGGYPKEGLDSSYDAPVFPVKDTSKVIVTKCDRENTPETAVSTCKFTAVDTESRQIVGSVEYVAPVSYAGTAMSYDGEGAFYLLRRDDKVPVPQDKFGDAPVTVSRVSYTENGFSIEENLWKVTVGKDAVTGWDRIRNKLIFGTRTEQDQISGKLYLVDVRAATSGQNDAPFETRMFGLPTDNLPDYPDAGPTVSAPFPISRATPAVLDDGSYIFPSGAWLGNNGGYWYTATDGSKKLYPAVWANFDDPFGKEYGTVLGRFLTEVVPQPEALGSEGLGGWRLVLPAGENKFFAVGSALEPIMNFYELASEEVSPGFNTKTAHQVWDKQISEPTAKSTPSAAYNPKLGYGVYWGMLFDSIMVFDQNGKQYEYFGSNLRPLEGASAIAMRDNGEVIISGWNKDRDLTIFTGRVSRYADFDGKIEPQTIDLETEESGQVTFEGKVADPSGDEKYQWQVKKPNTNEFEDIPGATTASYSDQVKAEDNLSEYRLLVHTAAGWTASEPATLTVTWSPSVTEGVKPVTVTDGSDASFKAKFDAPPNSTIGWRRYDKATGLWAEISADPSVFVIETADNSTSLTVKSVNNDMSGMKIRAYAQSPNGAVATSDATLTVGKPTGSLSGPAKVANVRFLWGVGGEMQSRPPAGGANYLSAGASDGTEATYKNAEGNVRILHGDPDGALTAPTYATRADFVRNSNQFVELAGGTGTVEEDGSGDISWTGAFSINMYGGMVPFTIKDPRLKVMSNGEATLIGDLSGYGASMDNPGEKHPLDPVSDVVVARFSNVALTTSGVITIDPIYKGVKVDVPDDFRAQNTEADGWGSWPQEFVDFQFETGLSSYWYTSSESESPTKKAPLPITVDFTKATVDGTGNSGDDSSDKPTPDPGTPGGDDSSGSNTPTGNEIKVIVDNEKQNDVLVKALSATSFFGSVMALVVAVQTWLLLATVPGGLPEPVQRFFNSLPWIHIDPVFDPVAAK